MVAVIGRSYYLDLMLCWRRGRAVAFAKRDEDAIPLSKFIASLNEPGAPPRIPGAAVYLTQQSETVPAALALNLKHDGIVHRRVFLLKVVTDRTPRVSETDRVRITELGAGFHRVDLRLALQKSRMFQRPWPRIRTRWGLTLRRRRSFWVGNTPFPRFSPSCHGGRSKFTSS